MGVTEGQTISQKVKSTPTKSSSVSLLVKELMGTKNVTMFCDEAGLSRGYVSRLLNGKLDSKPTVRTLAKIAYTSKDNVEDTFSVLLNTCGYNVSDEEKKSEIRIAKREARVQELRRKNLEIEEYEDVNLKASAIGLLFSKLLTMGVLVKPIGLFNPDEGIEFGVNGFEFESVIAIPAFCGNTHQEVMAERDILRRLLKSISIKREHAPLYLVLTDNADVFDYIVKLLNELGNVLAYVLRADKEGTRFTEQKFFATNDVVRKDIFKFVD